MSVPPATQKPCTMQTTGLRQLKRLMKPSTLRLIYPEVYLGEPQPQARIDAINASMRDYLERGLLDTYEKTLLLVRRQTATGVVRWGVMVGLDLEQYSWNADDRTLIRATEGTIVIMVGGDEALCDAQRPLLNSFSSEVVHTGEVGMGSVAKLINNMLAFCNMAAAAEALMMGAKSGIDLKKLDQVITNASGFSFSYRSLAGKSFAGDFKPGFSLDLAHKDLRLALELADELGVPGMVAPQVMSLFRMARGMGMGSDDMSTMIRVYEKALDTEVRA